MRILEYLDAFQERMFLLGLQCGKSRRQEVDCAFASFGLRIFDFLRVLDECALDVDSVVDPVDVAFFDRVQDDGPMALGPLQVSGGGLELDLLAATLSLIGEGDLDGRGADGADTGAGFATNTLGTSMRLVMNR